MGEIKDSEFRGLYMFNNFSFKLHPTSMNLTMCVICTKGVKCIIPTDASTLSEVYL